MKDEFPASVGGLDPRQEEQAIKRISELFFELNPSLKGQVSFSMQEASRIEGRKITIFVDTTKAEEGTVFAATARTAYFLGQLVGMMARPELYPLEGRNGFLVLSGMPRNQLAIAVQRYHNRSQASSLGEKPSR